MKSKIRLKPAIFIAQICDESRDSAAEILAGKLEDDKLLARDFAATKAQVLKGCAEISAKVLARLEISVQPKYENPSIVSQTFLRADGARKFARGFSDNECLEKLLRSGFGVDGS